MPIYEFRCPNCEDRFEVNASVRDADAGASCPKCGTAAERLYSAFASYNDGKMKLPARGPREVNVRGTGTPEEPVSKAGSDEGADVLENLRLELKLLREQIATQQQQLADLEHTQARRRAEIEHLDAEVASHKLHLEEADLAVSSRRQEVQQLDQSIAGRQQQLRQLAEELEERARQLAETDGASAQGRSELEKLRNQIGLLDRQTEESQQRRDRIEAELQHLRAEVTEKNGQVDELDRTLEARRRALEQLQLEIEQRRTAAAEIENAAHNLRETQNQASGLVAEMRDRAAADLRMISEEVAAKIREAGNDLRKELDQLLQQTLKIAGKAAQIDADLRTKEWLSRLLLLLEGQDGLRPNEVRTLAVTVLGALRTWMDDHPDIQHPDVRAELNKLIAAFRGWEG